MVSGYAIALSAGIASAAAATALEDRFRRRTDEEDRAAIGRSESGDMGEEERSALSEELTLAAKESQLSPACAARAAESGLIPEEAGLAAQAGAYRNRYELTGRGGAPWALGWAAAGCGLLAGAAALGAAPLAICSSACALASAWLDMGRRTASPALCAGQAALGLAAAGAGPAAGAAAMGVTLAASAAACALARRAKKDSIGRGDALLLAAAYAPLLTDMRRLLAFNLLLVAVLGAQAAWLRARGRRGEQQPLACSLALPYLAAMCL